MEKSDSQLKASPLLTSVHVTGKYYALVITNDTILPSVKPVTYIFGGKMLWEKPIVSIKI